MLLLFGGAVVGREQNSLWAYKPGRAGTAPGRWVDLSANAGVLRRAYHAAVWDSADGVMLVFGGETNGVRLADTWAYRPGKGGLAAGTWARLNATGPAPRQSAMAAWDSGDRVMLLAGGYGYGGPLSDLWAFRPDRHGAAGAWTRLASTTPLGPRAGSAAVWDTTRGRLLVFGGDVPSRARERRDPSAPDQHDNATVTATVTPTATQTPSPAPPSATATASASATPLPTNTSTNTATATPTPTATNTNTATPTPTATDTATATPTQTSTTTGGTAPRAVTQAARACGRQGAAACESTTALAARHA